MRLMNVETYELEDFIDENQVEYAILSHRWEKEEVLFEHAERRSLSRDINQQQYGWNKVKGCCRQARNDGHQWVWIDTCCINKESSAELQEAINSMYKWYQTARICYLYLSDVEDMQSFSQSQWFTRGWTLQELVAPTNVQFYGKIWTFLDTKIALAQTISEITKVDFELLRRPRTKLNRFWNCEIMSWAANRHTTRTEDRAYSLFDLFDVNLPLLYGEGDKAFQRLQEATMSRSTDLSLFAWCADANPGYPSNTYNLLAYSPDNVSRVLCDRSLHRSDAGYDPHREWVSYTASMTVTSAGIAVNLKLLPVRPTLYFAVLFEKLEPRSSHALGIYLLQVAGNTYKRVRYQIRREPFPVQRSSDILLHYASINGHQLYNRSVVVVDVADHAQMQGVGASLVVPTANVILQDQEHHCTVFSQSSAFREAVMRQYSKANIVPHQLCPGIFQTIPVTDGEAWNRTLCLPFHRIHLALDFDFMLTYIVVVEEKDSHAPVPQRVARILSFEPLNNPFAPVKFEVMAKLGGLLRIHPRGVISYRLECAQVDTPGRGSHEGHLHGRVDLRLTGEHAEYVSLALTQFKGTHFWQNFVHLSIKTCATEEEYLGGALDNAFWSTERYESPTSILSEANDEFAALYKALMNHERD